MKFVMIAAVMVNVVVLSGCGGGSGGSSQPPIQADVDAQGNCSQSLMADISRLSSVQMQQGVAVSQGYQAPGTYGLTQSNVSPNSQLAQNQQQVAACDTFFARHATTVSCKVPAPVSANPQTMQASMPQGTVLRTSDLKQQCDIQRSAYAQQLNTQNPNQQNAGQQSAQAPAQVNSQAGVIPQQQQQQQQQQAVPAQNQIIAANSVSSNAQNSQNNGTSKHHKKISHKVIKNDSTYTAQSAAPSCNTGASTAYGTTLSSLKSSEVIVNVFDTDKIFTAYTQDSLISQGTLKRQCDVAAQEDICSLISIDGGASQIVHGESMVVASKNEIGLGHHKTQLVLTFAGKSLGIKCIKHGDGGFTTQDLGRILGEQMFTVTVLPIQ